MKYTKYFMIAAFIFMGIGSSYALPRFALRMGARCIDCHIDPTGGGMRNKGGWHFGWKVLPLVSPRDKSFKMDNHIADNIEVGLDYRTQYVYSQQFGKTAFQKMEGTMYTNVDLSDEINAYAQYDFVNQTWEAFAVAHILPNESYVKAGTFYPDFGLRIDDHTAYTRGGDLGYLFTTNQRRGLIFDPRYSVTGVELGYNIGDVGLITASVGSPVNLNFNSDPTYTASIQVNPVIASKVAVLLGASYTNFRGPLIYTPLPTEHKINMYGGYAGFGVGNFTLMGEYDMASDYESVGANSSALMLKGSYRIVKGLEGILRYDKFDPNTSVSGDEVSRFIVGAEFFPYSFVEVRPQYRFQFESPSVKNDVFLVQFHFYY